MPIAQTDRPLRSLKVMLDIHTTWLSRTQTIVERLHEDLTAADPGEVAELLRRFHSTIEPAPDRVHGAVLSIALTDICRRTVLILHDDREAKPCSCYQAGWLRSGALADWDGGDPRQAFLDWTSEFLSHFEREHPRTRTARAAALIRADPAKIWKLNDLARAVDCRPLRLSREFVTRFGLRPSAYLHLVRTARAVALLRTPSKVESIAWEVGYRSKKDLYAALKRWVGRTPTELRALSDQERDWLERQLREQCVRGSRAPSPGPSL